MKRLRRFKVLLLAVATWGATACAAATTESPEPITPEYLLKTLVQIATQEDLVDEKRIGSLLRLDIVLQPRPPVEGKDGQMIVAADGRVSGPADFPYGIGMGRFSYAQVSSPRHGAYISIGIDRQKLCIHIKDVAEQFGKHGTLRPAAPPIEAPLPPGTVRPPRPNDQPLYGYWFTGEHSSASLNFGYSNCMSRIHIQQPRNEK